jgi:hypothetical protein
MSRNPRAKRSSYHEVKGFERNTLIVALNESVALVVHLLMGHCFRITSDSQDQFSGEFRFFLVE